MESEVICEITAETFRDYLFGELFLSEEC